jgi:NAD(P)H-dependent FMN reductase
MKIQIIIGSTREHRFSDKPAKWIYEVAKARNEFEFDFELVDLRDYPLPFFEEPKSPIHMQGKYSNAAVQSWAKKVAEADGYIFISPEYNHGYPAVLKNAIDAIYPEWNNKPVGFLSYGNAGGARAVEQLRLVAIEMQMAPIHRALHVPSHVYLALVRPQEGDPANPFESMTWQANAFLDELAWWTRALKVARDTQKPVKPPVPPAPTALAKQPA